MTACATRQVGLNEISVQPDAEPVGGHDLALAVAVLDREGARGCVRCKAFRFDVVGERLGSNGRGGGLGSKVSNGRWRGATITRRVNAR